MEVLVRKPPTFTVEPENMYQRKISESVEMHCDAQEAEGTQKPKIQWQRVSKIGCAREQFDRCCNVNHRETEGRRSVTQKSP